MMDKVLTTHLLGNRVHPKLKETIKYFFRTNPDEELRKFYSDELNKKLKYCNKLLIAGEQIFKQDCRKDKEQLLLIKLQIELYLYSYDRTHSNPDDLQWQLIVDYYKDKFCNQLRIL
jgi:hypothetical protein